MTFDPLTYPLALLEPLRLSVNIDFVGHVPFAMNLVDLMRPATIVELGTLTGNSYCAFCQAVKLLQLPTRCAAVDTWKGDASIGAYDGDAILRDLQQYHDPKYGSFSRLIRTDFDSALSQFADGSIDLLHIDGCHTYEAVRHDFEAWLPKVSDRGVVLFHDTTERREGFGVWKFWAEISARYANFNFDHSHGLGVLLVGRRPEPALVRFLQLAAESPEPIKQFFASQGKRIEQLHAIQYMTLFAWKAQNTLNQWCAAQGKPVGPQCSDVAAAIAQSTAFLYQLNEHVQKVFGPT